MARVSTRIEPFDRNIVLAIQEGEPPADRGRRLATYARQALADAQEINRRATGHVPPHETFVDGRKGAPLESVKPDGVIVFEFDLLNDMFEWIAEMLIKHSPVLTGEYQDSHIFFADGVEVEPGGALPAAEEYVFLSPVPYARKIERGLSSQAPDGVYEAVAAMAKSRFGNLAHIRFSYRSFQGGGINSYIPAARTTGRNKRGRFTAGESIAAERAREHATRQPAIVIQMR